MNKVCRAIGLIVAVLMVGLSIYGYICAISASVIWHRYPDIFNQGQYCELTNLKVTKLSPGLCSASFKMNFYQFKNVFDHVTIECPCHQCPRDEPYYPQCYIDVSGPTLSTIQYHVNEPIAFDWVPIILSIFLGGAIAFSLGVILFFALLLPPRSMKYEPINV